MVDPTPPTSAANGAGAPASQINDCMGNLFAARALDAPLRPGIAARLDGLEIVAVLGEGGMGIVLLARDPDTTQRVAVKLIKPALAADPHMARLFLKEARHMQGLVHPNILPVLDLKQRAESSYCVLPYMEHGSLARLLVGGQPLKADRVVSIGRQIGDALAFAHGRAPAFRAGPCDRGP